MKKIITFILMFCLTINITLPAYAESFTQVESRMSFQCRNITDARLRNDLNKIV